MAPPDISSHGYKTYIHITLQKWRCMVVGFSECEVQRCLFVCCTGASNWFVIVHRCVCVCTCLNLVPYVCVAMATI